MTRKVMYIIALLLGFNCSKNEEPKLLSSLDKKHTKVDFINKLKPTKQLNILDYLYYYNGAGVSVGDINNDDLVDVFFTSNQGINKLYLNKGNFVFEDITEKAGVSGNSDWNTGTVMADVNGDGFLDIYVCAVVGTDALQGANELYINNGNNTFAEKAKEYGLDFKNYSTTAAFFDFDNDGDLDMYLLNHAIHTQNSFGKADIRNTRNDKSGDKLLRNDGQIFTDVSEQAGIYGGVNGYGLGLATQDFNNDGYVDIYVSNDFHEDDYYYLNNGDGTFSEQSKNYFGKTSRFSMGSDVADINHDGFADILTLDMAPEDEKILKASMGDETPDMLKIRTQRLGYHYQYARNMLQINNGYGFSETALYSGIASTDWSWSALFTDINQDGEQDIFISNGIPKRPNDLDYIKFVSNEKIKENLQKNNLVDEEAIKMMPTGAVPNFVFEGQNNLSFKNQSGNWISKDTIISTGSAYADFDNDGDLDFVTNNINSYATFYKNNIDTDSTARYLKLKFRYKNGNQLGIGTKVISYHQGIKQYKQLFTSKGFQSSSEAIIHFGYANNEIVDSLKIIWPDNTIQTVENVKTNQTLTIIPLNKRFPVDYKVLFPTFKTWFIKDTLSGLKFKHIENNYSDFNRHKLIPYQLSDRGPATAVGDLNRDGLHDVFFGSSKGQLPELFIQTKNGFTKKVLSSFIEDKLCEDTAAIISDLNNDGFNDLFVGSGGGEYYNQSKTLLDRLYLFKDNLEAESKMLPQYFEHASVIKAFDADNDGDMDIFVGNHANSMSFGELPNSYILINNKGTFQLNSLGHLGMVTDAIIADFNDDDLSDIIAVGEWMEPVFLQNTNGNFKDSTSQYTEEQISGLWQSIASFDIDGDGDEDYILGNFGLNSKFIASKNFPMKMYVGDFDNNKRTETIIAIHKNDGYYTLNGFDELASQLVYLKKKYTSYQDFAGETVEDIFGMKELSKSNLLTVNTLASGYLKNENGKFVFIPFPNANLQLAPITTSLIYDFDGDGIDEILLAGNYFGVTPYQGKLDSFTGAILKSTNEIISLDKLGIDFSQKAVKGLNIINFNDNKYLIVTINNDDLEIYKIQK
ncbi:VCBS repeat-containing protein [Litoribaculum gwangyangense]|uniref:VCBS repeat-containing protein n=1 Tax=Litoribaculum gwangyangense TaxID=1130722 RepID=A0ABP9CS02_9FLAO